MEEERQRWAKILKRTFYKHMVGKRDQWRYQWEVKERITMVDMMWGRG